MSVPRKIKPEYFTLLWAYGLAMAAQRDTLDVGGAVLRALGLLVMDFGADEFNRSALAQARNAACSLELPSSVYSPDRGARDGACGLLIAIIDGRGETEEARWASVLAEARPFQARTVEAKESFTVVQNLDTGRIEWRKGSETFPWGASLIETWSWDGYDWLRSIHHDYGHVGIRWNDKTRTWEAKYGPTDDNARKITVVVLKALTHYEQRAPGLKG